MHSVPLVDSGLGKIRLHVLHGQPMTAQSSTMEVPPLLPLLVAVWVMPAFPGGFKDQILAW